MALRPSKAPRSGSRLAHTPLSGEIEFLTARARTLGSARVNDALAAVDLKVRSYSVLALAASGLDPSQRELADFLLLDASQIVALVDELAERGLVSRAPDARDRRSNVISATATGRRLSASAGTLVKEAENESLAALSGDEREQLRTLLRRVGLTSP